MIHHITTAGVADERVNTPPVFLKVLPARFGEREMALAQQTFNEAAVYEAIRAASEDWSRRTGRKASVLDLCSAQGLTARAVHEAIPVSSVTLVDTDRDALVAAEKANWHKGILFRLVEEDAATLSLHEEFDIVIANSAYHHIPDERKSMFLKTARQHLAIGGILVVGDHFLPPYGNQQEKRTSIERFYTALIEELNARGEPDEAIDLIRYAAWLAWTDTQEFKVHFNLFSEHCRMAGLAISSLKWVWQPRQYVGLGANIGTAVVTAIAL